MEFSGDDYVSPDPERRRQYQNAYKFLQKTPLRLEPLWNYIPRMVTEPHGQGQPGDSLEDELPLIKTAVSGHALRMTGRRVVLRHKQSGQAFYGTTFILPIPGETLAQGWSTNVSGFLQAGRMKGHDSVMAFVGRRYTSAILCGSIAWERLIQVVLGDKLPELHLDLYASERPNESHWLGGTGNAPLALASANQANFSTNYPLRMYVSKWTLAVHTTPLFDSLSTHYRAYAALCGGTVVTALMAALLAVQIRARVRQQNIACELREALTALEAAHTEREQVGRDLHDGAIQSLYALQLGLSRMTEQARAAVPQMAERLAEFRHGVSAIIGELRHFILRNEAATSPGANLCRVLTASINRLRSTTTTEVSAQLDPDAAARLNSEQAVQLANVAREALSNSLRHGSPAHIQVTLSSANGSVRLEIGDDGCGFNPAQLPPAGMGLANMSGRAREAGGELRVDTSPGHGTRVVVLVAARNAALSEAADKGESV
jgi:signal transduction histidine kinase